MVSIVFESGTRRAIRVFGFGAVAFCAMLLSLQTGCDKDKSEQAANAGSSSRRAQTPTLDNNEDMPPGKGRGRSGETETAEMGETAGEITFETLFDGTSLKHFRGYASEEVGAGWKIVDGVLHFDGTGGGDICTRKEFGDFELTFDWKLGEGANSGVMYRVSLGDSAPYLSGPEYQVLDDAKHADGKNELTSAGSLYALYPPVQKTLNAVGEWNESRIVVTGGKVEHWLNGTQVVSADILSDDWKERVSNSKFKDWEKFGKNETGHICFQDHGDPVWYRNIRIREIKAEQ